MCMIVLLQLLLMRRLCAGRVYGSTMMEDDVDDYAFSSDHATSSDTELTSGQFRTARTRALAGLQHYKAVLENDNAIYSFFLICSTGYIFN